MISHDPFHGCNPRHIKSAAALAAVAQLLREQPVETNCSDFLELYSLFRELDDEQFEEIWRDPRSYWWSRVAYELLGSVLTGVEPPVTAKNYAQALGFGKDVKAALNSHLNYFKLFCLAAAVKSNSNLTLKAPLELELPISIPGTTLTICGKDTVGLLGFVNGKLLVNRPWGLIELDLDSKKQDGLSIEHCPESFGVLLQPAAFTNLPGFTFTQPVIAQGMSFHRKHLKLVSEALESVRDMAPGIFQDLINEVSLIGLKRAEDGDYTNLTHSDLPGAVICAVTPNALDFAETLIHEYHHNKLFLREEVEGAFFCDTGIDAHTDARYFSPARRDPRPLHGILHALYVYLPVQEYWCEVIKKSIDSSLVAYARSRVVVITYQLNWSLHQVKTYGQLTQSGEALLKELTEVVEKAVELAKALGLLPEEQLFDIGGSGEIVARDLTALDSVRQHLELSSVGDEQKLPLTAVMDWVTSRLGVSAA